MGININLLLLVIFAIAMFAGARVIKDMVAAQNIERAAEQLKAKEASVNNAVNKESLDQLVRDNNAELDRKSSK